MLVATLGIDSSATKSATIAFSCALRQPRTASRGLPACAVEIVRPNTQIAAVPDSRALNLTGDHLFVGAGAEPCRAENLVLRNPLARAVESLLGVRLEHDALAGSPSFRVHGRVIADG